MAPERQDATHKPHPLHSTGLIWALPVQGPSSAKNGAEYGQTDTQTPHWLHMAGAVSAMIPLVKIVSRANNVTAREAAAWSGVAVLKRLHKLLTEKGYDPSRVKPLVASLRIYEGDGYENLPSAFPDVTETLGTGIISVFPNVRRAFDQVPEMKLEPWQVEREVSADILDVLSHSEILRQAYYVADRSWVAEEDERFCPIYELTLQDEAGTFSWAPVHHTLTQFIDSYDTLVRCVLERRQPK